MTTRQQEELSRELERHRGQWVVIRGTKVIASAPTLGELKRVTPLQPGDRRLAVRARHRVPYIRR